MTDSSSTTSFDRLGFLDAVRGLAAIYVVTFHLVFIPNPSLQLPFWATSFIQHGDTGVTLFFIASAFTLAYSMNQRHYEPDVILRFYLRRIFRIFPLFYLWLIIYLLKDILLYKTTHSLQDILLSITFIFNFIPGKSEGIVWASWTLGIEVVFYLFFPIIYKYVNNFWKSVGFLFLTITVSSIWVQNISHYLPNIDNTYVVLSFLYRLPSFCFGLIIFFCYQKIKRSGRDTTGLAFTLISASLLGYYSMITGLFNGFVVDELYWEAAFCSLFVMGLAVTPFKLIVNKISIYYGKISYSLYLDHPLVVFYLIPVFRGIYNLQIPTTLRYLLCLSVVMIVLTLLASLTYYLVEKPGIKLGNRVIKNSKSLFGQLFEKRSGLDLPNPATHNPQPAQPGEDR